MQRLNEYLMIATVSVLSAAALALPVLMVIMVETFKAGFRIAG